MLELAAIWTILTITLIWFARDERRLREEKLMARARYFATAAHYRHRGRS